MTKGNGKDKALVRRETLRQISTLEPKQKLEALINAPNARELVRAMPAEELYYAIADVGLADATDIVQLASPQQFRTFVDLGGWKRDRIDPHEVLTWLRAARTDEPESSWEKFDALDPEVTSFLLRSVLTIHDLEENPDVNPPGVTMESPEGRYLFEFHVEGVELAAMRGLINDLLARNPLETVRMLEATRWEVPSELEETAFRFRSARLEDLGFPPLERATSLFGWLDPQTVSKVSPLSSTGAALAPAPGKVNFLDAALRALDDTERDNLQVELRALANSALVAEIQDPGDLDAVRRVGEMVRDYLSLGIEHLASGDPAAAAEVVREHESRKVFQVGFSLTLALKFRADRLAREPLAQLGGTWLVLPDEAKILDALQRKRPLRAVMVEGAEPVPFRSRRELEQASRTLDSAEAQVHLFRALLGGTEEAARERLGAFSAPLEELGTDRLLAAAVGTALLEGQVRAAPIAAARVAELCGKLFEGTPDAPKVRPDAANAVLQLLEAAVPEAHRAGVREAVNNALARLRDEVGPAWLTEGKVDPTLGEVLPIQGEPSL